MPALPTLNRKNLGAAKERYRDKAPSTLASDPTVRSTARRRSRSPDSITVTPVDRPSSDVDSAAAELAGTTLRTTGSVIHGHRFIYQADWFSEFSLVVMQKWLQVSISFTSHFPGRREDVD